MKYTKRSNIPDSRLLTFNMDFHFSLNFFNGNMSRNQLISIYLDEHVLITPDN